MLSRVGSINDFVCDNFDAKILTSGTNKTNTEYELYTREIVRLNQL